MHRGSLAYPKSGVAAPRHVLPSGVLASRQTRLVSVIGRPRVGVIKTTAPLFVDSAAPSQSGSNSVIALT